MFTHVAVRVTPCMLVSVVEAAWSHAPKSGKAVQALGHPSKVSRASVATSRWECCKGIYYICTFCVVVVVVVVVVVFSCIVCSILNYQYSTVYRMETCVSCIVVSLCAMIVSAFVSLRTVLYDFAHKCISQITPQLYELHLKRCSTVLAQTVSAAATHDEMGYTPTHSRTTDAPAYDCPVFDLSPFLLMPAQDVLRTLHSHSDGHTDVRSFGDDRVDVFHTDGNTDVQSHGDSRTDVRLHGDGHIDALSHDDGRVDVCHDDGCINVRHADGRVDASHADDHTDTQSHSDCRTDVRSHADSHVDVLAHADGHVDVGHTQALSPPAVAYSTSISEGDAAHDSCGTSISALAHNLEMSTLSSPARK